MLGLKAWANMPTNQLQTAHWSLWMDCCVPIHVPRDCSICDSSFPFSCEGDPFPLWVIVNTDESRVFWEPYNLVLSVIESLCIMWYFKIKLFLMEDHVVLLTLGKEKQTDLWTHTSFKLIFKQQAAQVIHLTDFHCAPIRIGSNALMTWRNVVVIVRGLMESSRMRTKFCTKCMLPLVAHAHSGPRSTAAWDWAELAAKGPLGSHGGISVPQFLYLLGKLPQWQL
jgi:hypothetical protein